MIRSDRIARRLASSSPRLYPIVRAVWRLLRQVVPMKDRYWAERQNFNYFNEVVRLCRAYEPDGARVIDVGSGPTQLLRRLDWFGHRVALDQQFVPWRWRIKTIRADFLEYQPKHRFDLVLCLQVLEHLADPAPFARKLLATGRTVIITVPYKWPSGLYPPHVQDPVDEAKLQGWTGRTPSETRVVHDSRARLIAVYRETDGP